MIYTYLWLREDGTPYYVGKGTGQRAFVKRSHRFPPPSKSRIILQTWSTEKEAFFAESFLIKLYGREDLGTGTLLNLTEGGEGAVSGQRLSPDTEFKKGHIPWNKGKHHDTGWRGRKHNLDSRSKMRAAKLGKKAPWKVGWRHGTSYAYKVKGCRCAECRAVRVATYKRFGC